MKLQKHETRMSKYETNSKATGQMLETTPLRFAHLLFGHSNLFRNSHLGLRVSPRRRGFTLIEILMVVVILGIASAIILPQLASRDDLRCAAAARALMADLLYAQSRAIARGQMQYVQFSSGSYQVMADNAGAPGAVINNPVT